MQNRTANVAVALAFTVAATAGVSAQSWEYKSFRKNAGGQWDKTNFIAGSIRIDPGEGDRATLYLQAARLDLCHRGGLPATVTKTAETTTIEVTQPVPGCDVFRYVIRNDGSGGIRQNRRADAWVDDGFDHGLTPLK